MRVNIIVGNNSERMPRLMNELEEQRIEDYELWEGIFVPSVKESINRSHKQIVEYAKLAKWEEVCIAEDDIKFFGKGAWEYFLNNKPNDYDLYLSGIFLGDINEHDVTRCFTGLHLYIVHERFYDTFLSVPDDEHLDRALNYFGKYVVCNPFVATQHNGVSANTRKQEQYDELMNGRMIFGK